MYMENTLTNSTTYLGPSGLFLNQPFSRRAESKVVHVIDYWRMFNVNSYMLTETFYDTDHYYVIATVTWEFVCARFKLDEVNCPNRQWLSCSQGYTTETF